MYKCKKTINRLKFVFLWEGKRNNNEKEVTATIPLVLKILLYFDRQCVLITVND